MTIQPEIQFLVPAAPVKIKLDVGQDTGVSDIFCMKVNFMLQSGSIPVTFIARLKITNSLIYTFENGNHQNDYAINLDGSRDSESLIFRLKNVTRHWTGMSPVQFEITPMEKIDGRWYIIGPIKITNFDVVIH
jgi:hypothetical protein